MRDNFLSIFKAVSRAIYGEDKWNKLIVDDIQILNALDAVQQEHSSSPISLGSTSTIENKNEKLEYKSFLENFANSDSQLHHSFNTFFDNWYNNSTPHNKEYLIDFLLHTDKENVGLKFIANTLLTQEGAVININHDKAWKMASALSEIYGNIVLFGNMKNTVHSSDSDSNPDSDFTHSSGSLSDAIDKLTESRIKSINLRARHMDGPKKGEAMTDSLLPVIRGEIATYAQSMMGWFRYAIKKEVDVNDQVESILYVKEDAKIIRPHGIVGNLGSSMGDHLVPFSTFLKELEAEVRGKKVIDAIESLQRRIAHDTKYPGGLIERAGKYIEREDNSDLGVQVEAFSFLCWELIPSIVAIHNQALGTAFARDEPKTKSALAKEAALVKAFLAEGAEGVQNNINNFISVIDYAPVKNPDSISVEESIETGVRINHINSLSHIMIDVVDTFFRLYPIDNKISKEVAGELIGKMLEQKGWIPYYENEHNSADLGQEIIRNAHHSLKDDLQEHIIHYIKSNSIILADVDSVQHSSDISKRNSETDAMDITDNYNLVRSEKSSFTQSTKFIDILCEGLSEVAKAKIVNMREKTAFQAKPAISNVYISDIINSQPKITLIAENNHEIDHKANIQKLVQNIEGGKIKANTAICLERKERGNNFGMQDVILLANILEYNKNTLQESIAISNKIRNSSIYQDAILYNVAKLYGIGVMGIEGKGLEHGKELPLYNSTRETHMTKRIEQLVTTGKNVIFPVGAAHIDGLKAQLPSAHLVTATDFVESLEVDLHSLAKTNNDFRSRVLASKASSQSVIR